MEKKAMRFTASWCGPCKMYAPVWEKVTEKINEWDLQVIDVDADPELASKYGIRGIPTTVFEIDGKVVDKKAGVLTPKMLEEMFENNNS